MQYEICASAISPPTFAQIASEGFLKRLRSYFDEVIGEYKERRDIFSIELNKIEGESRKPNGAFTVSLVYLLIMQIILPDGC
jgi:aspartate/methionine/tyrosine aminotransferase